MPGHILASLLDRIETYLYVSTCMSGASKGIGAETAVRFAARGAKVVLMARNDAQLQATALKCRESAGGNDDKVVEISPCKTHLRKPRK